MRCAIYTRKSTEEGLTQEFNSLEAQRECCQAYIQSQRAQGWTVLAQPYDDGGFTGANLNRPAMQQLLRDVEAGGIDAVVIYKVDRLSRSLFDFARLMQTFDRHGVSFVSVTQQLNSSTPMGRLTLHVLLSFAQFEREIISERTRDKISAARQKGKWMGGYPVLGYDADATSTRLVVNEAEAERVREIFALFLRQGGAGGHPGGDRETRLADEELDDAEGQLPCRGTARRASPGAAVDECAVHREGEASREGVWG